MLAKRDVRKSYVKECKKTKHLEGKHKGIYKSGRTCGIEWDSKQG